jgi:hypothetical protein
MSIVYGEGDHWVPVCGSGAVLYYNDPITNTWKPVCSAGDPIKYWDETNQAWTPLCCGANQGAVGPWISVDDWMAMDDPIWAYENWGSFGLRAHVACTYFEGSPPPGMQGVSQNAILTGVSWDGNYWPGLEDEWSTSPPVPVSPPVQIGPWDLNGTVDFYGGVNPFAQAHSIGPSSSNYWTNWNLWPYEGLEYAYSIAWLGFRFPSISNHIYTMVNFQEPPIPERIPVGTYLEWGPELAPAGAPPIIPHQMTMTILSIADANRGGGTITLWMSPVLPKGGEIPAFGMPGPDGSEGWVEMGTASYDTSDSPLVFHLDLSGVPIPPPITGDWDEGDRAYMVFALVDHVTAWVEPNPHPPDSSYSPYTWSDMVLTGSYVPGQITYRWSDPA